MKRSPRSRSTASRPGKKSTPSKKSKPAKKTPRRTPKKTRRPKPPEPEAASVESGENTGENGEDDSGSGSPQATRNELADLDPLTRRVLANLDPLSRVLDQILERYELALNTGECELISGVGFRGDNLPLAIVATDILRREQPITLRGLFYRVVSAGWLPSTDRPHSKRLGRLMTRLREAGVVPFDWIVDGIRATEKPSSWTGLSHFAQSVRDCYRLKFWASMPHYICFIVEKDAMVGTLRPVTWEYDVALHPIRGYTSLSFAHEIASEWKRIDKPVFCYYLGDYDPSGFDLQRDIKEKLERYSGRWSWYGEGEDDTFTDDELRDGVLDNSSEVLFRRIAVVRSDFDEFNLLPLAVKDSDSRSTKFRKTHGSSCAELDAIPASELRRRVREIIESHITHRGEWERLKTVEAAERETLDKFILELEGAA
jgi:hypothetical protein